LAQFSLPFNVANPDTTYIMPQELREISGLSSHRENQILTINDEKGFLYSYDFKTDKIVSKTDFGKKGDYESVASNDNTIYVGESNGNIKVIDLKQGKKIKEYDTPLSGRNDLEGMCFDSRQNQLLLACKGQLMKKNKDDNSKGIYSFDLEKNKFNETPYKLIDLKKETKELTILNLSIDQFSQLTINSRLRSFAPSGIAIDPISTNIYIISSRGKMLVVMDNRKTIIGVYFLPKHIFGQPEGISFDDKGDMHISNEANSTKANILKFKRIEDQKPVSTDL